MKRMKLIDIWNDPNNLGVTSYDLLVRVATLNNDETFFTSNDDIQYFFEHSGEKWASPLLIKMLEQQDEDEYLLEYNKSVIANIVSRNYWEKWDRLKSTIFDPIYDPIENYDIHQVENPNMIYDSETSTMSKITKVTDGSTDSDIYGFNSTSGVSSSDVDQDVTETTTRNSDDNIERTSRSEKGSRTTSRRGNNGERSYQDLQLKELELRRITFLDVVFQDLDKLLTLPIY